MPTVKSPPPTRRTDQHVDNISDVSTPPSSPESSKSTDSASAHPYLLRKSVSFDPNLPASDPTPQENSYYTRDAIGDTRFGLPEGLTLAQVQAFHFETQRIKNLVISLNNPDASPERLHLSRSETLNEDTAQPPEPNVQQQECKLCVAGSGKKPGHNGAHRKHTRTRTNQNENTSSEDSSAERHSQTTGNY